MHGRKNIKRAGTVTPIQVTRTKDSPKTVQQSVHTCESTILDTPASFTRRGHRLNWMYITSNFTTEDFSVHILRVLRKNDIDISHKREKNGGALLRNFRILYSIPYFSSIFKLAGQYPICIFTVIPVTDGTFVEID